MRKFQVTVNGNTYEVDVEEINGGASAAPAVTSAPTPAPAAKPAAPAAAGGTKVPAPMQGKIVGVKVTQGQQVKEGDVLVILEAMKMENEVVAPCDGTVASVNVSIGQNVETGDLLVSLN